MQDEREKTVATLPHSSSSGLSGIGSWLPLFSKPSDFRLLLSVAISHPLAAVEILLPQLDMFGGISFNPDTDIPDLSGKIILVTGGKSSSGHMPPAGDILFG